MTLDPLAASRAISRGRAITLFGLVALAGLYVMALQFTPPERFQGLAQKIFYLHPPAAYAMQLAFILTGIAVRCISGCAMRASTCLPRRPRKWRWCLG